MESIFSYYMSEEDVDISALTRKYKFGKYILLIDEKTKFDCCVNDEREFAILGLAVDVITGESERLASKILEVCDDIDDIVKYEMKLGGKYVLFYKDDHGYYIQGDATCSIPVFYNVEGLPIVSSNEGYICNERKYLPYSEYVNIRNGGDLSQAMPYDITIYKDIKQLVPNHYLLVDSQKSIRFVNSKEKQKKVSCENATELILPMIKNITEYYDKVFDVYCPLTSGKDSRVVLAFLRKLKKEFLCYTIRHSEHNDKTPDILIPRKVCEKMNINYELFQDAPLPQELVDDVNEILGKDGYSHRTLMIAHTIKEHYGSGAVLSGDIMGQIGKCSLHRDISTVFATPFYFRCKLHNFSSGARKQLKLWKKEIELSEENVNIFDLFSVENRMGRWAGQTNLVYNTIGQPYLNIFNSRSIIYTLTSVERKERKKSRIHYGLIKKLDGDLLTIPFEEDSIATRISKSTGMMYLISSVAKYLIDYFKFKISFIAKK